MRIDGLGELKTSLEGMKSRRLVKDVVRMNTAELQRSAQENASKFRGHYEGKKFVSPTGTLMRSISMNIDSDGFTGIVKVGVHYAPYVEYGTRFMASQPYMRPAFNKQKEIFLRDLQKIMK